jgi:deoxyadenosine/deoxycytidine kinase
VGVKRYVAVAGTIGAGKTSLVAWLVKRYGLVPFYEPNEGNPYLTDFYADMKTWAFHSQAFFLAHKLKLHQQLAASAKPAVIDRTIYEDAEIFARNLHDQKYLSKRDWAVYRRRGRENEASIPDAYLRRLHRLYTAWFERYDLSPVVHIDTGKLDYVEDLVDLIDLTRILDAALR